ncbi:MAG: pilus assembly protein N-terminal domain-containing protein [Blastocatellia bacterium]|nr:pilus assembly protein N-terminal domain-containing protein [Blastocatellia bacterium]
MLPHCHLTTFVRLAVLLLGGLILPVATGSVAQAQETVVRASFLFPEREPVPVNVLTGQSCLVIFDQSIGRLAVSNTENAEAVIVAPNQMMINGKTSGRARFTTWAKDGERFVFFDVDVRANLAQIDSQVRALFPNEDIRLSQANGSVVISGNVDPKVATQVEDVIKAAGFKTVNLLSQPVQGILQVQLQLRLAEVSRNRLQELGFSPAVTTGPGQGGYMNTGGGPYTLDSVTNGNMIGTVASSLNLFIMTNNVYGFLRALQTQGALRALAEPNLVAMNGQQASFLAGGEIPVPVIQSAGGQGGTAVVIQWKEYGVRVNFKPTILDEQHIRLEIEPEVSTLDYTNAIRFNGFLLPSLRTRKAKTGIELRDGQSFGIAGLLDNTESRSLSKIPVLANIPVLGNLFKSKQFQKNETELVFIVTAKLTEPVNPDAIPNMKGLDKLKGESPLGVELPGQPASSSTAPATGGEAPAPPTTPAPAVIETKATPAESPAPAASEPPAATPGSPAGGAEPEGAKQAAPAAAKPVTTPQPPKHVTRVEAQELHWRLRIPQTATLTAQQVQEKQ